MDAFDEVLAGDLAVGGDLHEWCDGEGGQRVGPDLVELAATGREFSGKSVGTFTIAGGKIVARHIYYDRMIVVDQLMNPTV